MAEDVVLQQTPAGVGITHQALSPKLGGGWHTMWWTGPSEKHERAVCWTTYPEEAALFPTAAGAADAFTALGSTCYRVPAPQLALDDVADTNLVNRSDDWWAGYRAGVDADHAANCTDLHGQVATLRAELVRERLTADQRVTDVVAEMRRQIRVVERQRDAARTELAQTATPTLEEADRA